MSGPFKPSSTTQTRNFYESLHTGKEKRGLWGKENRFDPELISGKVSVSRHFTEVIAPYLARDLSCLDLGCGPGGFLTVLSPMCGRIVGVDVVPSFVEECRAQIARHGLTNATALLNESARLPFDDGEFDRITMVDTIHHLENVTETLDEIARVLKPDGLFLIFEPNKLNPVLALMCALDKNEHGLLRMGTFGAYRRLLSGRFSLERESYNGLLIGPTGKLSLAIADLVSDPRLRRPLGWLSPKLFLVARKT